MFEAHVLHLLRQYLGEYVRGLSVEALKISVWKGDVVLKDLQLKAEALNALKLPITVKAGFLGSVTLKVPWNRLGKDPVIVLLDRIFVLAEPLQDEKSFTKADKDKWFEAKRRKCEEAELAMLEAKDQKTAGSQEAATTTNTWFSSLIATIVGNLKISITNLHIRYEDTVSNPKHPFCSGVTLATLAAVTIDEAGHETFVTSGALERLRKSLRLERLAMYHNSSCEPWKLEKAWEDMTTQEWSEVFEEGITKDGTADAPLSKWASGRQYLLHPVGGLMTYNRRGKREKRKPDIPFQEATLVLEPVSLTVSEAQYCDGMKLLEGVSTYRNRLQHSQFRPQGSVSEDAKAWWLYGCQAVLQQQTRVWYRLQWSKVADACCKRRKYVQLYASCLHQSFKVDNQEIKDMEEDLDVEVILLWRLLAHARVESVKSKEAAMERERIRNSSWWSFGWGTVNSSQAGTPPSTPSGAVTPPKGADDPGQLTKEEWSKINQLLSYQPGEDVLNVSKHEAPNMMQIGLDVNIQQGSARVLDSKNMEILCGTFENLQVGIKVYPKTLACDGKLQFYGLSAPEGVLIESVSREGRDYALAATYVQSPFDENLDWKLSATMSPCHVKVWRVSFERFLQFLKSSQALSPGVALETAAVLQSKLEEVTRRAQEQLQLVFEQQSRFSVYLDLDAPKITIPAKSRKSDVDDTQLLLDLGHFTLHTANDAPRDADVTKADIYSRFLITGSEISAFVVDREIHWSEIPSLSLASSQAGDVSQDSDNDLGQSDIGGLVLPVLDRCGMSLVLDQIRVQHPSYPSTRLAIRIPRLGIHFSPSRYHKLMSVLDAIGGVDPQEEGAEKIDTAVQAPWQESDYSGDARILVWGGIGSTVAAWQPCRAVLAGTYLYILESESAETYQRCSSMTGKQVVEVPASSIGGYENVIAVCHRGVEIQKVIESSSAVIMQFKSEELKAAWQYYMALATYKASAPVLSMPSESSDDEDTEKEEDVEKKEMRPIEPAKQPQLLVMGFLQELQIFLSTATKVNGASPAGEEKLILELQAHGGKVDLLQRQYDMSIAIKLHSLRIEDKLQGHVAPSCRYLARSALSADSQVDDVELSLNKKSAHGDIGGEEEEEVFDDALTDFGVPGSPSFSEHGSFHRLFSSGRSDLTASQEKSLRHWEVELMSLVKDGTVQDSWEDVGDEEVSDFVNMRLIMRQIDSPDYDDTDFQMSIRMATLEFFCNRPTVVALIEFGTDLGDSSEEKAGTPVKVVEENTTSGTAESAVSRDVVKGLLGRGKSRVVFRLKLDMESARIYVNKEDGSQLGMLAQEKFRMDLKVYPGSLAISGTLGNLRVCDMFLGADHQWGWLCDIRDPGAGSLVELEFQSHNKDEDDYQGFDYSLSGKLSAVRIVFLYRFIQEITAYFVALATPQTTQVVTVVDKVGGMEKLIQQSDVEGQPAVKLDFSLDTPSIIMPRRSDSQEFMQLDLGHLEVHNNFEWHGGEKDVASAVHLDVLCAELTGINMVVGINGQSGKPMIREARGLQVKVQRPLRDLFKKVPEVAVDVQVPMLSGVMSHKEYLVIIDCASTNMSELPNLPPTFRAVAIEPSDEERMLLEMPGESEDEKSPLSTINFDSVSSALTYTKVRVTVDVRHVELDLYIGGESETALARLEIRKFWLSYCNSSANNMDVLITLSKLSVLDQRWDTRPEMRLMLGSMADVEKLGVPQAPGRPIVNDNQSEDSSPQLTMLVLDLRFKPDSQAIVLRVQRPRLLVVVDFLLAVGEFFVPSLGDVTGRSDLDNSQHDAVAVDDHIRLTTSLHLQEEETVVLSAQQQLIVEAHDVDEFVYDGCGKTLCLNVRDDGNGPPCWEPLIFIGWRKKLRFKNIHIKNGFWLSECVHLSLDSSYSATLDDDVFLEGMGMDAMGGLSRGGYSDSLSSPRGSPVSEEQKVSVSNYVIDIQAVAPELTFYDSTKWPAGSPRRERVLRANLDCYVMIASKGNDKWIRGMVKGLKVEGGSGLVVVDPLDVSAEYACVQDKITLNLGASDISMRLSFNVLSLILRFHDDALSTFRFGGAPPLARCTHFDRIWVNSSGDTTSHQVAIWRPRAPPGYLILGDCATSGIAPPSQAVMAISNTYRFAKKPVAFELLWSTNGDIGTGGSSETDAENAGSGHCCVWRPVAPPGYLPLGCIAERGFSPPSLSIVRCIRSDFVTSGSVSDCIFYIPPDERGEHKNGCSIWRMENAAGSFYAHSYIAPPSRSLVCELSETLLRTTIPLGTEAEKLDPRPETVSKQGSLRRLSSINARLDSSASVKGSSGRYLITTPQFERLWWDKGSELRRPASIWRPIVPPGYAIVGDCLVESLEPPSVGVALRDENSGRLAKPLRYLQRMHTTGRGLEDAVVWFPVAPAGYVAVGCVVTKSQDPPSLELVRCLRVDLVTQSQLSKRPWSLSAERSPNSVWSMSGTRGGYSCSMWRVENQANTFIARPDLKRPPGRMAYALADGKKKTRDKLTAEIKIGRMSITVFDDMAGLMTPLVDLTITSINLAAHGRVEAMSAVVITNMAASTFNTQLESWEPFIEPFEGIFKYESFDVDSEAPLKVGKRIRITAANVVNVNATSAGLETLVESVLFWRKQTELEQQARMSLEMEESDYKEPVNETLSSALEEDESERLTVQNQLGCDLYLRKFKDEFEQVECLPKDQNIMLHLPPPRFPDRFVDVADSQPPRHFVAMHVSEAKELLINDDGNDQDYMCALRLATTRPTEEQRSLPQSARSRCVRPIAISQGSNSLLAEAKWNEVFIFELPQQGIASLEILVTNQAAKGGRGEAVGVVSISIDKNSEGRVRQPSSLWNVVRRALKQGSMSSWPCIENKTYSLLRPRKMNPPSDPEHQHHSCGKITVSMYFFSGKGDKKEQGASFEAKNNSRGVDVGLWFAMSPQGPWTGIRSLLPLSTFPKEVSTRQLALEVTMQQNHKVMKVRSLIMVSNNTDIPLDVCLCPFSLLNSSDNSARITENNLSMVVEEIFENQRYQPLAGGWGSRWPGHLLPNDPSHWSNRDYSQTSQDFVGPPLPPGWVWTSGWSIDKEGNVDDDGWFYGPDFQSLKYPPSSTKSKRKSTFDFARRRRLLRARQCVPETQHMHTRQMVGLVEPGNSIPLPWAGSDPKADICLQVRPQSDSSPYSWGRAISDLLAQSKTQDGGDGAPSFSTRQSKNSVPVSALLLKDLEKTEEVLLCKGSGGGGSRGICWLNVEVDATVLYSEVNVPIPDWKITVNAPVKLENRLPCTAAYIVWEKPRSSGNLVKQQDGIVLAGGSVHIHAVDVRRPIYLTWLAQGGWRQEKEVVVISDPAMEDLPSGFWMAHQASGRRLRVSLEHDFGGSSTAAKIVRLFVPYWLVNDASLPLAYRLVEIEPDTGSGGDSTWLTRAAKAAKQAARRPSHVGVKKVVQLNRVVQHLEKVEDLEGIPLMLSLQALSDRIGGLSFSSRSEDGTLSPRLGLAVAVANSNIFKSALSFRDFESNVNLDIVKSVTSVCSFLEDLVARLFATHDQSTSPPETLQKLLLQSVVLKRYKRKHEGGQQEPIQLFQMWFDSRYLCLCVVTSMCNQQMERVDLKAVDSGGAYYKLSTFLDMSSDRTKVIHVQPDTLFVNRLGQRLSLRQGDLRHEELFYPNDPPKAILWQSTDEPEHLKIFIDGYKWSHPFRVDTEGVTHIALQREVDNSRMVIQAEVRNGVKGSRYFVVFRLSSRQSPYRVENRSAVLPLRFRQVGSSEDSWQLLPSGAAASFAWEALGPDPLLELLVDGHDPQSSMKYNIDEPFDYRPMSSVRGGPVAALQVTVFAEGIVKVIKVADWKPSTDDMSIVAVGAPSTPRTSEPELHNLENQFHTIIELAEFGLSLIDHTPEELLYVSIQNLVLSYATGLGSGTSRLKIRLDNLQVDCQLPLTPSPVLFIAQEAAHRDFLLKCTITMQDNGVPDHFSYPYIGIQGPNVPNVSFLMSIHEPIIWKLHEMFRRFDLGRLSSSKTTAVAIDPIIRIGLLHTSEIRFKVTLAMAPAQRPRGILGFWSTLITSLGNTDEMPIRITPRVHEDVSMRQSALWAAAFASLRNDLLSQPLQLLSGVDILGNTSSALGNMSKGVAALSMDKKFIQSRQKQANVEDIGDGIREGGEAFAKGLFRGVTGIVTKPFEGARSSGVEGFLQGVGKGVLGVGVQPLSGVLDLLSKTTEGANAMRMKLAAAITFEQQLLRRRLPRVIGGDNVLRPYDEYKARGQVLMQLAERGTIFGPVDFFRVRGKFAMSDAYEDHFNLPKGRTLMMTHRRVILLQHPTSLIQHKKPDLLKEPCIITWDVVWDDLMTMELSHSKEESRHLPPSRLIIHLRNWSQDSRLFDSKEIARIVKCHPGTKQAVEIRSAIQHAYNTYGPGHASNSGQVVSVHGTGTVATCLQSPLISSLSSALDPERTQIAQHVHKVGGRQGLLRMSSARKPYAGAGAGAASGAALGLLAGPGSLVAVPVMATFGALIGSASQGMIDTDTEPQYSSDREESHPSNNDNQHMGRTEGPVQTGRFINEFQLMWWDKGAPWSKKFQVSIWRPIAPSGYVSVGDVVQSCYEPPDVAMVYRDDHDGKFAVPEGFDLVWRDTESGAREPVTIWRPRPTLGYVAIGCVVVPDYYEPEQGVVRCVRQDSVAHVPIGELPLWRDCTGAALWHCSLWRVQNDAGTFIARRDHQAPPPHLAYTVIS